MYVNFKICRIGNRIDYSAILAVYSLDHCPPFGATKHIVENVASEESFERGSHDSGTGTLKKGATLLHAGSGMALRARERKLQEELDCERLSREVFLVGDGGGGGDHKLQSLFGKRFGCLTVLPVIHN